MIYKNNKRVKNGVRNVSFLGCFNNRNTQLPKLAKGVALRLAEKIKEEKAKDAVQQEKARDNKNVRNRSTNFPSNQQQSKNVISNPTTNPNIPAMNRSGNGIRKPENPGIVKLPKVATIGNSNVSNTSMKAVWEGVAKKAGDMGSK